MELQRINMNINRELWKVVGIQAIKEGIDKREVVEKALRDYINKNKN